METRTLVNVTLFAALALPIAALLTAGVLYQRRRTRKAGSGPRSLIVFVASMLVSGIAIGYVAQLHLPWPLCQAFAAYSDGSWCGVTPYIAGPLGFTVGTLVFAVAWSFYGLRPNST